MLGARHGLAQACDDRYLVFTTPTPQQLLYAPFRHAAERHHAVLLAFLPGVHRLPHLSRTLQPLSTHPVDPTLAPTHTPRLSLPHTTSPSSTAVR